MRSLNNLGMVFCQADRVLGFLYRRVDGPILYTHWAVSCIAPRFCWVGYRSSRKSGGAGAQPGRLSQRCGADVSRLRRSGQPGSPGRTNCACRMSTQRMPQMTEVVHPQRNWPARPDMEGAGGAANGGERPSRNASPCFGRGNAGDVGENFNFSRLGCLIILMKTP